mmetsp:Transcript_9784/g.23870  ORF Transcript_9784/g.23870 Transcript_9784/m.23870 type:complete len:237 (+) Transcript_9784:615-1325(+)
MDGRHRLVGPDRLEHAEGAVVAGAAGRLQPGGILIGSLECQRRSHRRPDGTLDQHHSGAGWTSFLYPGGQPKEAPSERQRAAVQPGRCAGAEWGGALLGDVDELGKSGCGGRCVGLVGEVRTYDVDRLCLVEGERCCQGGDASAGWRVGVVDVVLGDDPRQVGHFVDDVPHPSCHVCRGRVRQLMEGGKVEAIAWEVLEGRVGGMVVEHDLHAGFAYSCLEGVQVLQEVDEAEGMA